MKKHLQYDPKKDYYRVLEISADAPMEAIRQAYRAKAKAYHPDLNPDRAEWAKANFQLVNDAYRVLSDPDMRDAYDRERRFHGPYSFRNAASAGAASSRKSSGSYRQQGNTYTPPRQQYSTSPPPRAPYQTRAHPPMPLYKSPYRYVLGLAGVLLVINMMFIVTALAGGVENSSTLPTSDAQTNDEIPAQVIATEVPAVTTTPISPFPASNTCTDPLLTVTAPESARISQSQLPLQIRGRVAHPDLYTYAIELVGIQGQGTETIKPRSTLPDSGILDTGMLGELQANQFDGGGSYTLRIIVIDQNANELMSCEIYYLYDPEQ